MDTPAEPFTPEEEAILQCDDALFAGKELAEAVSGLPADIQQALGEFPATLAAAHSAIPFENDPEFQLLEELGHGGMGVVHKAWQRRVNRFVAVKIIAEHLARDKAWQSRFETEAKALGCLQHPNIVQIFDVANIDGRPCLVLELVEGATLAQILQSGPVEPRVAAQIIAVLADAVHYAHQRGIIHRDLKPGNILLQRAEFGSRSSQHGILAAIHNGRPAIPKITDFGLAKNLADHFNKTSTGAALGTPAYVAPEQLLSRKTAGPGADIYSLGAVLYEILTGVTPLTGASSVELNWKALHEEPTRPRRIRNGIPRDLETICLKCLEKQPEQRYSSAAALAEDLRRFLADKPIIARPVSWRERTWRWCRRNPVVTGLLISLAIAVVTVSWLSLEWRQAALLERSARREVEAFDYRHRIPLALERFRSANLDQAEVLLGACPESLRDFEWRWLKNRCNAEYRAIRVPNSKLNNVSFSPDGRHIAVNNDLTEGRQLLIFDVESGNLRHTVSKSSMADFCWRPDSQTMLIVRDLRRVVSLDLGTGTQSEFTIPASDEICRLVICHSDGSIIATLHDSKMSPVRVWNAKDGSLLQQILVHPTKWTIAFHPIKPWIAVENERGSAVIVQARTGQRLCEWTAHRKQIACIAFSANGEYLATCTWSDDRMQGHQELAVWRIAGDDRNLTVKETYRFAAHTRPIIELCFSPDNRYVMTASKDGRVRFWELNEKSLVQPAIEIRGRSTISGFCMSPDGRCALTTCGDDTVREWRFPQFQEMTRLRRPDTNAVFSTAYSAIGNLLAWGDGTGELWVWNLADTTRPEWKHPGHDKVISSVAISPDSRNIATASHDKTIELWDIQKKKSIHTFRRHSHRVNSVVFHPNGKHLFSCGDDNRVCVWSTRSFDLELEIDLGVMAKSLAIAPSGKWFAVSTGDGWQAWDFPSGRPKTQRRKGWGESVAIAIHPNETEIAIVRYEVRSNPTIEIFSLPQFQYRQRIDGFHESIMAIAYHPDGHRIVAGSKDRSLRFFDVASCQEILRLDDYGAGIQGLAFRPDGKQLAVCGFHGDVMLLDAP